MGGWSQRKWRGERLRNSRKKARRTGDADEGKAMAPKRKGGDLRKKEKG